MKIKQNPRLLAKKDENLKISASTINVFASDFNRIDNIFIDYYAGSGIANKDKIIR